MPVKELSRKHGISEGTFYRWKSKYGGMEINEAKRLKQLEDELRRSNYLKVTTSAPSDRTCQRWKGKLHES